MRRRSTIVSPIFKKKATDHFDEDHSLQAKTGKTHAVC
jgi:glutamate decarboxylase